MKLSTPDLDFAAAMLSKGATLVEGSPWTKEGPRFYFNLDGVTEQATHEYRTSAATFCISAFIASRRFLLEVVKRGG